MFVRKKKNKSGSTSIVVIDKSRHKFRELETMGVSSDEKEINKLYYAGKKWISSHCGERYLFEIHTRKEEEKQVTKYLLSNVENILLNGIQLILDTVFRLTEFNTINDDVLKHLHIAQFCQPSSKSTTVDYLKPCFDEDVSLDKIYRYLDRLYNSQKDKIQQISVAHTRKVQGGKTGLVFYDVTTLYFETDYDDELRERSFSKDGKHSQPQVVLGLLASKDGCPLSYSLRGYYH
jgi:hypothetical protein